MSKVVERGARQVAISISRRQNNRLLANLVDGIEFVDIEDSIPGTADMCIVDEQGLASSRSAITAWKYQQRPTFAPVLLFTKSEGADPWGRYADALGDRIDAIQPIPAPKLAIRARIESLLEAREYSEELSQERQFVEQVFETSPIGKVVFDTDGNIIRANSRAEEILGVSHTEITSRGYDSPEWRIFDEDGRPIPHDQLPFARVMETGEPVYNCRHGVEHPDGETVWLSINVAPIKSPSGEIEYLVSSLNDITQQKCLERELRASEELHRTTLSNITDTVFITDDDGRFTYVCPNVELIFGYSVDDVYDMGVIDTLLGGDPAPTHLDQGEVIENIDYDIRDANGNVHTALITVKSVSIQGGTKLYSIRDVTELVESERLLKLEQDRLETVVSNAPMILASIDSQGTITLSKGRQLRLLGLHPGEVNGKSIFEVFDEVPKLRESANRLLDGESFTTEIQIQDRVFRSWNQPIFEDGKFDQGIIVAQDITAQKERLQHLQVMDRVLRHNLRNFMTGIRGYADLIKQHPDQSVTENADSIIKFSDRLLSISEKQRRITDVLSSEPIPRPIDAVSLIESTVDSMRSKYSNAHIDCQLPDEAYLIATNKLQGAVEEAVTNAVVHHDGPSANIRISIVQNDESVRIQIEDAGPGIPELEREVVLGNLEIDQLHHGQGLGLWLISRIVHQSNGTLSISENNPHGTILSMTFEAVEDR